MQVGYCCIKLKIGVINFEEELVLLRYICVYYFVREIELRVDVNGVFLFVDVMDKLNWLVELDLYFIEQFIWVGQWEEMVCLVVEFLFFIVLDEELIGCNVFERKWELLVVIYFWYIILKLFLYGGISGGNEWIVEVEK